jgi:hypothetical protein
VGDIDFLEISAAENSNKFQKTRFCKEKSVEDVIALWPMAQATLVYMMSKLLHLPSHNVGSYLSSAREQRTSLRS